MNLREKWRRWLAEISPTCHQATQAQSKHLDGHLCGSGRVGLWIHLVICRWCRRYDRQIRKIRDHLRAHPEEADDRSQQGLSPEVKERIKDLLRKQPPEAG